MRPRRQQERLHARVTREGAERTWRFKTLKATTLSYIFLKTVCFAPLGWNPALKEVLEWLC
jgi:hypothetical protein